METPSSDLPIARGPEFGEPPIAGAARTEPPHRADGGGEAAFTPLVIRGESQWIGYDEDTGESAFGIPVVRRGVVCKFKFIPLPHLETRPYAAITDWLNFSFPLSRDYFELQKLFEQFSAFLGPAFTPIVERRTGKHRYERSYDLGKTTALFACGGNNDTALLSLSGEACALIPDWGKIITLGRDELLAHVTRWDGAVDDYLGTQSVDYALQLYLDGKFGTGGRVPTMRQHGNWAKPDGKGRGIEIGNRENGKRLQVYEKGMQLGAKWHPWTRWEVQLGSEGRIIPWEVLQEPGRYVVGAYPKALNWIQDEMSRIKTLQKHAKISYEVLTHYAKQSYGRFINVMLATEGSAEKVITLLKRDGLPRRLVFTAEHLPVPSDSNGV